LLVGLTGLILGWAAFPALLVALLLQAVLFGYGGLTTLGINTFTMAFPAVICYYLFNAGIRRAGRPVAGLVAFLCGGLGVALACLFTAVALVATGRDFTAIAYATVAANAPVMVIEGFVTCSVVLFLRRVRPEMLEVPSSFLQK
jgi:cobalt/nickel transport system permease protein